MFADGYSNFLSSLIATGKNIIFFMEVPELGMDPQGCIAERPFHHDDKIHEPCALKRSDVMARRSLYRKEVQEIKNRNPSLKLFDSTNILCDDLRCYGRKGAAVLYWDENHLSVSGSAVVLTGLLKEMQITPGN